VFSWGAGTRFQQACASRSLDIDQHNKMERWAPPPWGWVPHDVSHRTGRLQEELEHFVYRLMLTLCQKRKSKELLVPFLQENGLLLDLANQCLWCWWRLAWEQVEIIPAVHLCQTSGHWIPWVIQGLQIDRNSSPIMVPPKIRM